MAFRNASYIQSGRMGLPNTFAQRYSGPTQTGPARSDITLALVANTTDNSTYATIYVEVAGNYNPITRTGTPIDKSCTPINLSQAGFSVRSGTRWGATNVNSVFRIDYDFKDGWPNQFQVQVGASGGGGTSNTVFVFSKGVGVDEAQK
jgi:hypothetical protein